MKRPSIGRGGLVKSAAIALLALISCGGGTCGGSGCGGCSDGSYTFPRDDPNRPDAVVQDDVLRVRVTQDFLDFIRPQLPAVLASQLAGQGGGMYVDMNNILHIPIPNQTLFDIGVAEAEMRDAEALLWLDDLADRMDIQFVEPNGIRLTIDMMRVGVMLKLKEEVLGADSSCPIYGNLGMTDPRHAAEVSINALIDPGVGPDPDYDLDIQVTLDNIALDDLDIEVAGSSVYCQEPECMDCAVEIAGTCLDPGGRCNECNIFCGGITNGLIDLITSLIDLVRPLINGILRPVIEGVLGDVLNGLNGSSAKVETALNVLELAGLENNAANPVGVFVAPTPGRFPVVNRMGLGMEVTVNGGAEGEAAPCVGEIADFIPMPGPVPEPPASDMMMRPYHIWATFASTYLNQFLYAAHRSGTLCLKLSSEDVAELTNNAFTLNASLLSLLASDLSQLASDRAPVIVELKPRNPGFIELGSGELVGQDAMGNDVYDWLLQLTLEDLGIAFHVLVHDRYVRTFEVTTDIFVGMNINILPDNNLEIAIGELRIDDFSEEFNELLPNADFAMVLPTILDLALGAFLNDSLKFDLDLASTVSDALGGAPIGLRLNEIHRDGIQQDYLSLTMTMTSTPSGMNLALAADTWASLHPTENGLVERIDGRMLPTGRVRLNVGEGLPYTEQMALEYQVRVDFGLWRAARAPRPDGTLFIEDAKLMMPGHHTIEVRSRYAGDYASLDPTPAKLDVVVDPFAPEIRAVLGDDAVTIDVVDLDTQYIDKLHLEAKIDDGEWFDVEVTPWDEGVGRAELRYADLAGTDRLELRATDPVGNVSDVATMRLGLAAEMTEQPQKGCACDASREGRGYGYAGLIVLIGLLFRRRR